MNEEIKPWGMEEKQFLVLLHLSQFAGFLVPGAGLVLPILMWVMNKDQSPSVDQHGKIILNWMISALIYSVVSAILIFVVIGIFTLIAIAVMGIVFAIIGAVKANKGECWQYPCTIPFFK